MNRLSRKIEKMQCRRESGKRTKLRTNYKRYVKRRNTLYKKVAIVTVCLTSAIFTALYLAGIVAGYNYNYVANILLLINLYVFYRTSAIIGVFKK